MATIYDIPPENIAHILSYLSLKSWLMARQTSNIFNVDSRDTKRKRMELLNEVIEYISSNIAAGIICGILNDDDDIINVFIRKGASNYQECLSYAAYIGNYRLVKFFMSKKIYDLSYAISSAELGNHQQIKNYIEQIQNERYEKDRSMLLSNYLEQLDKQLNKLSLEKI